MKLTAINSVTTRKTQQNKQSKQNIAKNNSVQNKNNNNVSFKGFADFATVFWNFVDKGGRGLQFTVEDMLGTNIPRTYSGAMSGYEYTHEINWQYLYQEGIREFLTGPTMTLAPIGILAAITRASGKTANIHRKNISNLSYLADKIPNKENLSEEAFKKSFLNIVVNDMLTQTTGQADPDDVNSLIKDITKYGELTNSKVKADKKQAKELLAGLKEKFETIAKATTKNFSGRDFQSVSYSTYGEQVGKTGFENYIKYMSAYAQDYAKTNKIVTADTKEEIIDLAQKTIQKFEKQWRGKRGFTMAAMIFLTGYIMSFIPKLYTLASGGINPGGKAIYAEAQKREGK